MPRIAILSWALVLLASAPAGAAEFLGADRCGSCHQVELEQWKRSGHALALARLSAVQQKDPTCRGCHTTAPSDPSPNLSGVQCESCHGPGTLYAPAHVMRDKSLAALYGLEPVTAATCTPCHASDGPSVKAFDFDELVKLVRHRPEAAKAAEKK